MGGDNWLCAASGSPCPAVATTQTAVNPPTYSQSNCTLTGSLAGALCPLDLLTEFEGAADARGGSGFMEVSASHAALLLAQGAGRLLRSMDDRGVVAVLDPRLVTKRYGEFLRATLPPFWQTTDPAVVRGALTRLAGD